MSLQTALEKLFSKLGSLREAVAALQLTILEDKPRENEPALVDWIDNVASDLLGALDEALAGAAKAASTESRAGSDLNTRSALRRTHDAINRFSRHFRTELTHESIARLLQMGRQRGREWLSWSEVVDTSIDRCVGPLNAAHEALAECWDELAERLASGPISLRTTNIGQQINLKEIENEPAQTPPDERLTTP